MPTSTRMWHIHIYNTLRQTAIAPRADKGVRPYKVLYMIANCCAILQVCTARAA